MFDRRKKLFSANSSGGLGTLLTSGLIFYAPLADKGNGEVSLIASGAGASQTPTFTRATTATTVNSSGTIVSVSSGVARSYYDPTTLQYLGYLAEGARTNSITFSQDYTNAAWSGFTNETITDSGIASPIQGVNFYRVEVATSAATNWPRSFTGAGSASGNTLSVYVRKGSGPTDANRFGIRNSTTATDLVFITFNYDTGAIAYTTGSSGASAVLLADGLTWRLSISATTGISAGNNLTCYFGTVGAAETAGEYNLQVGAQLEAGSFPSTYIPTEGSAVTRNADVLTYPSSGNVSGTVGTAYAEVSTLWTSGASQRVIDVGTNSPPLFMNTASIAIFDGTTIVNGPLFTGSSTIQKLASSWGGSTMQVAKSGSTNTAGAFDGNMNLAANISIGSNGSGSAQWFGTIRNVRIWTTQFSAAQLQAITA